MANPVRKNFIIRTLRPAVSLGLQQRLEWIEELILFLRVYPDPQKRGTLKGPPTSLSDTLRIEYKKLLEPVGPKSTDLFVFVFGVAELSGFDGNGHLHQEGEDEETYSPDAEGHHEFQEVWDIDVNLAKRVGDKSRYDEPGPFLDPDPNDDEKTTQVKSVQSFSGTGELERGKRLSRS